MTLRSYCAAAESSNEFFHFFEFSGLVEKIICPGFHADAAILWVWIIGKHDENDSGIDRADLAQHLKAAATEQMNVEYDRMRVVAQYAFNCRCRRFGWVLSPST